MDYNNYEDINLIFPDTSGKNPASSFSAEPEFPTTPKIPSDNESAFVPTETDSKPSRIPVIEKCSTSSTYINLYDNVASNPHLEDSSLDKFFDYKNDTGRFEKAFFSPEYESGEVLLHPEYVGMKLHMSESENGRDFFDIPTTPNNSLYDVSNEKKDYINSEEYEENCKRIEKIQTALFSRAKFISEEMDSLENEMLYYSTIKDLIEKTFPCLQKNLEKATSSCKDYENITVDNNAKLGKKIFNNYEVTLKKIFNDNKNIYPDKKIAEIAFQDEKFRARQFYTPLFKSLEVAHENGEKSKNCKEQLEKYKLFFNEYNGLYNSFNILDNTNINSRIQEVTKTISDLDSDFKTTFNSFKKLQRPIRKKPPKSFLDSEYYKNLRRNKQIRKRQNHTGSLQRFHK